MVMLPEPTRHPEKKPDRRNRLIFYEPEQPGTGAEKEKEKEDTEKHPEKAEKHKGPVGKK